MNRTMLLAVPLLLAAAGCFDEPQPAYATVDPASRAYLKESREQEFSPGLLLRDGLAWVEESGYTNLSALTSAIAPEKFDYLNLDRSAFTNVDAVAEFVNLKWLRLSENGLKGLPASFSALKKLKALYLRGNPIDAVPEVIREMPSLTVIDLSETGISEIPEWFAKREGMEHLDLSRTKLRSLPEDISAWESLKSLKLGDLGGFSVQELRRVRHALPRTAIAF